MPDLVLFQPDIPGNTGTLMRLGACLDLKIHVIEPAGFRLDEKAFRRAGMDYIDQAVLIRHMNWTTFDHWRKTENRRLILLTTKSQTAFHDFKFGKTDLLMLGRESSGVPAAIHKLADERITIPMQPDARSLNMAVCGAIVACEALRQTGMFKRPAG